MVVDRTTEFFNIVESMRDDVQVNESASLLPSRDMKVDQNFHQIGKQVTSLIQTLHDTKLEDLRKRLYFFLMILLDSCKEYEYVCEQHSTNRKFIGIN